MKAVILVGGEGTRLRPLTHNTPKAMMPVLNTPFLVHVLHHLARHQVTEITLAQGYLAQPIEGYLGNGRQFGVKLSYVAEDTPLGTAGAVKNAEKHVDEAFLVLNGDIFTDLDITAMIEYHRQRKATATLALTPVEDPTAYGLIETNAEGRISRFLEKPKPEEITTNMINAGTYVLKPEILKQIPPQTKVSFEYEVFPQLLAQGKPIYAYPSPAYWMDMGTPAKYLQLHRDLLSGKSRQYAFPPDRDVTIGEPGDIHPTAQINGPAIIGAHCTIGRQVKINGPVVIREGCTIREESVIEDSILWQNVWLGPRVSLKSCIVAGNCSFHAGSTGEGAVLGHNVTVPANYQLEPGCRIEPGTTLEVKDK